MVFRTHHELNTEIARAFGITDLTDVSTISIHLSADEVPTIRVTRWLYDADTDDLRSKLGFYKLVVDE